MSKKRQKYNLIFPILFLIFPFVFFLIISIIKYFNTGIFNYGSNFTYFYAALKNYKEYIFPTILFLTVGLSVVFIKKLLKRKFKPNGWIILLLLGIFMILCGSRILFIISNNLWNNNFISFIFSGVNFYTFIFSTELCILVLNIVYFFDRIILKSK